MNNEEQKIPRRNYEDKLTPTEKAIRAAINAVEEMPADTRLTSAVVKLGEALHHVSDYIDDSQQDRIRRIARVCHEANRAYCESIGDNSQNLWYSAEQWQRDSAMKGVEFALEHPDTTPEHQHEAWRADKVKNGWKYGPIKDPEKKEHPCMVPYADLPEEQRKKDILFRAIVFVLK